MEDDGVHDHAEDRGGQGVALYDTSVRLKKASELPVGLGYHGQLVLVRPKKSNRPGTDPVRFEKVYGPLLVQEAVGFPDIQEDPKEDSLTHGRNLLEDLGLEGGGPHPPSRPKPVEHVMEGDHCSETAVEKARDRFPEDLDKYNPP